jgi:cysteine desulfurase
MRKDSISNEVSARDECSSGKNSSTNGLSPKMVYMDNNATTRVAPEVLEDMLPYLSDYYGNPSSMHAFGGQIGKAISKARLQIASLIGAEPEELVFTSCGTESDSTAILSALQSSPEKRHIVTTRVEHPAIKNLCENLKTFTGHSYRLTQLPVERDGTIDLDTYKECLADETAIVSVMWANNETGVIFPIAKMAQIARQRGILFHTDAVQAVGKIAIDLKEVPVDFLSLSGHKLHAAKGVGVLYVRKGTPFSPFIIGGHQEEGRRGGTENVASIVGLGKACEMAGGNLAEENNKVRGLRDKLEKGLLENVPNSILNGHPVERLPNTSNISFEYVEGESILLHLDRYGICASSGSACTSGSLEPSHVLRAMGIPFTAAHGSIRFSLSIYNTEDEVDYILEKLPPIISELREMSPFWNDRHRGAIGLGEAIGHGSCNCKK